MKLIRPSMSMFLADLSIRMTNNAVVNLCFATLAFIVGAICYYRGKSNPVNQIFFVLALSISFWTMSSTMADVVREVNIATFWTKMAVVGPFIFAPFFLIFSYYFPRQIGGISVRKAALILAPCVVGLALTPTMLNVDDVQLRAWGTDFTPGPLYIFLFGYLSFCVFFAARNFFLAYHRTGDALVRKQVVMMFIGMGIVVVTGLTTNLILPILFSYAEASVAGPASSAFFVIIVMYAIMRHGLMNVRVIATELFASALSFMSFVEVFTAESVGQYAYRTTAFVITLVLAILLMKSVNEEVRRREQIQKLAKELTEANEHLKEVDKLKSEFISIASHQLRTPISVIKGYLSLLIEGAYGACAPMATEKIRQMFDMNERLVHMVNNMLNISSIEKNKIEFSCKQFDVVEMIKKAVLEMTLMAGQKGLKVEFVSPPAKPVKVFADPERLSEVLGNVIDNAVKYSERGTIEVSLKTRAKEEMAVITVKDEGLGMSTEDRKHIFEKFFRAKDAFAAHRGGTGLGLYICARFLRGMGGDIKIGRSVVGKGTTFVVAVPLRQGVECALNGDDPLPEQA